MAAGRLITPVLTEVLRRRFWSYVLIAGPDECWLWTRSVFKDGYGQFRIGAWKIRTHRLAYIFTYGELSEDAPQVLHTCDVRRCCNPRHLRAGTHMDNMHDMVARNRQATGLRSGHYTTTTCTQRGERHGMAKLTDEDVLEMRRRFERGAIAADVARAWHVSHTLAPMIRDGKIWLHLIPPTKASPVRNAP